MRTKKIKLAAERAVERVNLRQPGRRTVKADALALRRQYDSAALVLGQPDTAASAPDEEAKS